MRHKTYHVIPITKKVLSDIDQVIGQIKEEDYSLSLDYFSGATVGQHIRHILDFYICLFRSEIDDCVCYDKRNRDLDIENNPKAAQDLIHGIQMDLEGIDLSKKIILRQTFGNETFEVESSLHRELSYNLEHTIHHLAIIKIALKQTFQYIEVDSDFGVAYSTVSHRQEKS